MLLKTTIREIVMQPGARKELGKTPGLIGEHLRRYEPYRQAALIFVSPSEMLRQIRMNVLTDNKALLMPSSNMREGFYLLKPFSVSFKQLGQAVTLAGMSRFGTKLKAADLGRLDIDLVVADALAVDRDGYMTGDGHGFLDLAVAVLSAYGALSAETRIVSAVSEEQKSADHLPHDPWDVRAHGVLTAAGITTLRNPDAEKYPILWDHLTMDRIKRITPLWQLYRAREDENVSSSHQNHS